MNVVDNEFTMKMGNEVLMTVGKDEVGLDDEGNGVEGSMGGTTSTESTITFTKQVDFNKDVKIHGDLHVKGKVKEELVSVTALEAANKTFYNYFKLWKDAFEKYNANSNDTTVVDFPMGDNTKTPTNEFYQTYENRYVWNGFVDNRIAGLAPLSQVKISDLNMDTFVKTLNGLGMNLWYVTNLVNNNMWPTRPFYVMDSENGKGVAIRMAKEFLQQVIDMIPLVANDSSVPGYFKQGLEFMEAKFQFIIRMATEHDYPSGLEVGANQKYWGAAPYRVTLFRGLVGSGQTNIPRIDMLPESELKNYDFDNFLDIYEKELPRYINSITDFLVRINIGVHSYDVEDEQYLLGYDKTGNVNGSPLLDEEGVERWNILGQKVNYSRLLEAWWKDELSMEAFDKLLKRELPYNYKKTIASEYDHPFLTGALSNVLKLIDSYLSKEQKDRAQSIVDGPIANAVHKYVDVVTNIKNNPVNDDFPINSRSLIREPIEKIDAENHKIIMKDGSYINFDDERVFRVANAYDAVAQEYLSSVNNYTVPSKLDKSLGFDTGKTKYTSISQITENWTSVNVPVVNLTKDILMGKEDPDGGKPVLESLYNSGNNLIELFDELKAFGFNELLKRNDPILNEFTSNKPSGSRQYFRDGSLYIDNKLKCISDWDALGYHYGLPLDAPDVLKNAVNTAKFPNKQPPTAEQRANELDSFKRPKFDGTFPGNVNFDYVLREHYQVDEQGVPLVDSAGLYVLNKDYTEIQSRPRHLYYGYDVESKAPTRLNYTLPDVPYQLTYTAKYHKWAVDSLVDTLFYEDGGKVVELGIYDEYVLNKAREYGITGWAMGNGYSAVGDFFEPDKFPTGFKASMMVGDVAVEPEGRDKVYFPTALKNGGEARIVVGYNWQLQNIQLQPSPKYSAQVALHEALGHGIEFSFQSMETYEKTIGNPTLPWVTRFNNKSNNGNQVFPIEAPDAKYVEENVIKSQSQGGSTNFYIRTPGNFGEGFATWQELSAVDTGILGPIDIKNRKVITKNEDGSVAIDPLNLIPGMILFSRLAARQKMAARISYLPYSKSASYTFREFSEDMGRVDTQFWNRFVNGGVLQQATYALGLTNILLAVNEVKKILKNKNKEFSLGKFNTWRINSNNKTYWGDALITVCKIEAEKGTFSK